MSSGKYHRHERLEMLAFLPQSYRNVLEIGCGAGLFSAKLASATERWGIEPDAVTARAAAGYLDRVLIGKYDELQQQLPAAYFDLVICNDVIEHLPDHDAFLASIREKLCTGGALVASIPNVRYWKHLKELLFQRDWRYREAGILDRTHLRFFTERSIRRDLERHAFAVERLAGINGLKWRRYPLLCVLVLLSLGRWRDMRYLQFAVRAIKSDSGG